MKYLVPPRFLLWEEMYCCQYAQGSCPPKSYRLFFPCFFQPQTHIKDQAILKECTRHTRCSFWGLSLNMEVHFQGHETWQHLFWVTEGDYILATAWHATPRTDHLLREPGWQRHYLILANLEQISCLSRSFQHCRASRTRLFKDACLHSPGL